MLLLLYVDRGLYARTYVGSHLDKAVWSSNVISAFQVLTELIYW